MNNQLDSRHNFDLKNERTRRRVSFVFWLLLLFVFIFFDQYSKQIIFTRPDKLFWIGHFLPIIHVTPFLNYYFAFSLRVPLVIMYLVYATVIFFILRHIVLHAWTLGTVALLAWVLIIAGACSNVFERIWLGSVRDFLAIGTGIFNVADVYISVGVLLLLFHYLSQSRVDDPVSR